MKIIRYLLVPTLVILVFGTLWYFTYPIKIHHVMDHIDETEKIDFIIVRSSEHYSIQFDDHTDINGLIEILNSTTYRRELKSYKGSTDEIILMIIVYRDKDGGLNNYSIDINESGKVISNYMQYQMYGDARSIFNNLYEWIETNGTYIPKQ